MAIVSGLCVLAVITLVILGWLYGFTAFVAASVVNGVVKVQQDVLMKALENLEQLCDPFVIR